MLSTLHLYDVLLELTEEDAKKFVLVREQILSQAGKLCVNVGTLVLLSEVITKIDDATKLQETYEIVFVSSHAVVRQYLREQKINYKVILPHAKLYKDWCDKLLERSIVSGDIKDTRAFGNCYKEFYNSYTEILINDNKNVVVLESMDYDLDEIIKNLN